jgi:hypothetical protein
LGLDWEKLFKRYVWDDRTTPYLVPLARLDRRQADYEIAAYCLFLGILFGVVSVASLGISSLHGGQSPGMALYAFSVVCGAVLFGVVKSPAAALYLSATPLAGFAYVLVYGFGAERELLDTVIVCVVLLILLRYSLRIVAISRVYSGLPEASDDDAPRRRLFKR